MTVFAIVGIIVALAGLVLLVTALRGRVGESPRSTAMLIAGMMLTAFGIVLAGFAIVYSHTAPLDFNSGATQ
ncbi:putative membrane protein [Sphingomonas sp. F9_3S_D5_B_2]